MARGQRQLSIRRFQCKLAADAGALDLDERNCACFSCRADESDRHFIGNVESLNQDILIPFESG